MKQPIEEVLEEILSNKTPKRYLLSKSFFMFIHLYLKHYFHLGIPILQEDMIRNLENRKIKSLLVTSFIGGGKTTVISIAYLLWEAFRTPKRKVILHISKDRDEAFALSAIIKEELLNNEALVETFGEPNKKLMTRRKIILPKVNTTIIFSYLRAGQMNYTKPDILIIDDAFERKSYDNVKDETNILEKILNRFVYTRVVVTSSIYNRESVMFNLFSSNMFPSKKLSYPIYDDSGQCLWEKKFSKEKLTEIRASVGEDAWHKSYLVDLRIVLKYHYWQEDVDDNWEPHKDEKSKQAYIDKNFKNTLYFDRTTTLGKYTFSTPKFGHTHIFAKKGEEVYCWY
jgi:hypothetical protein